MSSCICINDTQSTYSASTRMNGRTVLSCTKQMTLTQQIAHNLRVLWHETRYAWDPRQIFSPSTTSISSFGTNITTSPTKSNRRLDVSCSIALRMQKPAHKGTAFRPQNQPTPGINDLPRLNIVKLSLKQSTAQQCNIKTPTSDTITNAPRHNCRGSRSIQKGPKE